MTNDLTQQLDVTFEYVPSINFAMQQNHVPVIRRLFVTNTSGHDLHDLIIEITAEPGFAHTWSTGITVLQQGQGFDCGTIDLKLSTKLLSELTERLAGTFTVKVTAGDTIAFNKTYDVTILAYDQWSGIAVLPEILSAFVTPNHPRIPAIIRRAAEILADWTGNPSFDEYQSKNPDRVKKQMAAIYEAIAEKQFIYCSAPASFEETGQHIRIIDTIFDQQIANCLDLSLLYASCLEAVGINALIIVTKGHAFTGAWLINDSFADSVNDDSSLITKRIADGINDIIVAEATSMNAGHHATFDDAIRTATGHLRNEEDFLLFVDIRRSRFGGIRPLPLRIKTADGWEVVEDSTQQRINTNPDEIRTGIRVQHVAYITGSRQQSWERRLLDLSLRNNLLNLRISKNTLQFISIDLNALEDRLAAGEEFQVLPRPSDWDNPLRSTGIYQSVNATDPVADLVRQELSHNRLRSYLPEADLTASLHNLYRASRSAMEESGANTLYVALGMLRWYESAVSERPHFAPIVLLPVEIIRKTIHKGYIIRSREEDAIMNITLLEMLRQDFGITVGGLDALPKDGSGVDLRQVFNIIRQSVMAQSRWDVEEQAFLGTFSFSKFVMWNDIHANADKLARNKVVSSLISGRIQWHSHSLPDAGEFDKRYHPSDIALPISADSSQLAAICAAADDHSFVLHGPPGTGKSQTITNIIANSLYRGKKVLFVAEKMAALSVVRSRLEAIGIGPFCLELHSNKTKKSVVLEQLKKTIDVVKTKSPAEFRYNADRIHSLRTELNEYVEALHKQHPFGLSLHDIFTRYTAVISAPDKVTFSDSAISTLTAEKAARWDDISAELQTIGTIIDQPNTHPLRQVQTRTYTQSAKAEARELLTAYTAGLKEFDSAANELKKKLGFDILLTTRQQFIQLQIICDQLTALAGTPAALTTLDNIERSLSHITALIPHGKKRDQLRDALLTNFDKGILSLNATATLNEWNHANRQWFLPRWVKQRAIKRSLRQLSKNDISNIDIPALLQNIINYQEENDKITKNETQFSATLGHLWQEGNCDWDQLAYIADTLVRLNTEVVTLLKDPRKAKAWRNTLSTDLAEGRQAFDALYKASFTSYSNSYFSSARLENKLQELLGIDFGSLPPLAPDRISNCLHHAEQWLTHLDHLRDWVNWLLVKDKATGEGLNPLVTALEQGHISGSEVTSSYRKGLLRACAEYIFSREPALRTFNGQLFDEKISRFREISRHFEELTKEELFAKLASRLPVSTQEAAQSSELGILLRAIKSGARGMSIRRLFDAISNLLPRLTPCMLMSPISVAQYFDAGTAKFDLVIFDEASQMPTCEAVGAIARGTNVIIVGDDKQMPPTSFFTADRTDEDSDSEDLESILDDCLALSVPSRHLLWHYRSRHESLIAFSNAKYYDNKLLTFPSPDDIRSKVTFTRVTGHYDRSGTRQNRAEARAIVDEIIRRLSDPVLAKRSIGVVTFSAAQQTLVDDLLEEALKASPALEGIAFESPEPLFIKNLENVQGDERDVILFSVGYGPDKNGRVSLNFGPLNRTGGWRRLNVAVSRARYEMKVFSTLHASQIDITRTSSEGVAGLRAFLEYAEKGRHTLGQRDTAMIQQSAGLVQLVAEQLRAKGHSVNTNIGCSGYRIDIGIVDPAEPSRYLLAVLCDGRNYSDAKTARDREIVQYHTLRHLGWAIHRIWSADWWENPQRVIDGIIGALTAAQQGVPGYAIMPEQKPLPRTEPVLNYATFPSSSENVNLPAEALAKAGERSTPYLICNLDPVAASSSEELLRQGNRQRIAAQVAEVLRKEAPISRELLMRRVLDAWGITRAGTRITAMFDALFDTLQLKRTEQEGKITFWNAYHAPWYYGDYRTPHNDSGRRDADDLPPEEIANAIHHILTSQVSMPREELIRRAAHVFGFTRTGTNVEAAITRGLTYAVKRGYVTEENNKVVLKG